MRSLGPPCLVTLSREGAGVSGGTDLVVQHEEQRAAHAQVPRPLHLEPVRLLSCGRPVPLSRRGELGHLTGPPGLPDPRLRPVGPWSAGGEAVQGQKGSGSHLHQVVVRAIEVFVQLNDQTLEEGRELPLLLAGLWERNGPWGRNRERGGGARWEWGGWSGRAAQLAAGLGTRGLSRPPTPGQGCHPNPPGKRLGLASAQPHTHPRTPGETWARTYVIQELPLHPQLPGGYAAIRILCIRLRRVKSIGDIKT